jgi:photosystem II stability/assembly factor-like uncharacterized protein
MDSYYGDGGCCIVHPESANVIITGGQGPLTETNLSFVVSHSHDNGLTWTRCNLSSLLSGYCYALAVAPSLPSLVYAAGVTDSHGSVYRSTDRGVTWQPTATAPADTVRALEVHPTDPNHVYAATSSGLFATTDGGATWTDMRAGTKLRAVALHPGAPDTIVAAGDSGVVISYDAGHHWTASNQGLEIRAVTSIAFTGDDGGTLIAGTAGRGCFVWSPSSGIKDEMIGKMPVPHGTFYTGPTVVRGVLFISHSAFRTPHSLAALLDISGRKVLDLHPGANDIRQLAPGVYFVRSAVSVASSTAQKLVIQGQ